ncbi:MAG: oligosaccharide flippase family protein [Rubrobacteraceae bacterium]
MFKLPGLKGQQGVAKGTLYVAASFATSGLLTFVFHVYTGRELGLERYGDFGVMWTSVFLVAQVLWIGVSQTLGRYIAEREARGEDPGPVVSSVKRLTLILLGVFLLVSALASPWLVGVIFEGDVLLAGAFVAAVAAYAPEYFRRGTFGGHRQFARLGALHVVESSSRMVIGLGLLFAGVGMVGPAFAVAVGPLLGVLAVRPAPVEEVVAEQKVGSPFSAAGAFRFAGPVLACVAFGQLLMNGGPILARLLGGTSEEISLLVAALILARTPQTVLSPVVATLLPHASRTLATEGIRGFDRFVLRSVVLVGSIGIIMVAGAWFLGEWALLLFGSGFLAGRVLLAALAALAAFYLLSETLNQALFALGRGRLAALGWFVGLLVAIGCLIFLRTDAVVDGIAYSLALGALFAAAAQIVFYLMVRVPRG